MFNEIQVSYQNDFLLLVAHQINLLAPMVKLYLQPIDAMMCLIARMVVMNKDVDVSKYILCLIQINIIGGK